MSSLACSETIVENLRAVCTHVHVYCSYKLVWEASFRIIFRLRVHTRTRRLTGKRVAYRRIRTTARIQFATHVQVQSIIIHNQIQCIIPSHSVSSSQVSLYGPPLNQLCQDDLPLTSNIPLYQSQVPFSGVHLLNHARMTYTSTMKCPARYPAKCKN